MKKSLLAVILLAAPAFAQTWQIAFNAGPGTVTINNGSTTITGSSTNFTAADVDAPICDNAQAHCQRVASVSNTTTATLSANWSGTTLSAGSSYGFQQWCHAPANSSITVTCPAPFTAGNPGFGAAWIDNTNTNNSVRITDGNGVVVGTISPNSPCQGGSPTGFYWTFFVPYLFGSTSTITFTGTPTDTPDDVQFVELVAQAGYTATFDTDTGSCASSGSSTNPSSTMTLAGSNEFVIGVGKANGGAIALASPYTSYVDTTTDGTFGYDLNASSSITTTFATAGQGPGAVFAGAAKWVANTTSAQSGKSALSGNATFNATNPTSTIASVCSPTAGATSSATTAVTGTCNSTGATLVVCSCAWITNTGTCAGTDSLSNTYAAASPIVLHSGDGATQLWYAPAPGTTLTTSSSQTFTGTMNAGQRHTYICNAFSGTQPAPYAIDQPSTSGFGASTTCSPTAQVPAQYGDLIVTGITGNNIGGGTPTLTSPFGSFATPTTNTATWDSGLSYAILTAVEPAAPKWTITSDSGLNCTMALFRAHP
jgi:hypothetical protein